MNWKVKWLTYVSFVAPGGRWHPERARLYHIRHSILRSVQKVSSHVIWNIETFIEEDTRYKNHCTQDSDTSVHFKVGTLGPHSVLPVVVSCTLIFSWISLMVWNTIPFKVIFVLGKARSHRPHIWAVVGLSHLDDLMFCQKIVHNTWWMSRCIVMMKLQITSFP